jgi:hypothetical protein
LTLLCLSTQVDDYRSVWLLPQWIPACAGMTRGQAGMMIMPGAEG